MQRGLKGSMGMAGNRSCSAGDLPNYAPKPFLVWSFCYFAADSQTTSVPAAACVVSMILTFPLTDHD